MASGSVQSSGNVVVHESCALVLLLCDLVFYEVLCHCMYMCGI